MHSLSRFISLIMIASFNVFATGESITCTATAYRDGSLELVNFDLPDGVITRVGRPMTPRIHGMVRTNDDHLFGVNYQTDTVYSIDPVTGQPSSIGHSGWQLTGGLAYDDANDIIYGLGAKASGGVKFLLRIDRATGIATPIGESGTAGLTATSGLAWDATRNRLIAFDNADNEFYAFDTFGNGRKLSNARFPSGANSSWSLAHDGANVIMQLNGFSGNDELRVINPDTGMVVGEFTLSEPAAMESLDCRSTATVPEPAGFSATVTILLLTAIGLRRGRQKPDTQPVSAAARSPQFAST